MQKLIALIEDNPGLTEPQKWNLCREVLQILILKSIYGTPEAKWLVFQGGTCLRICHGLKRYSEDLDFSLVKKTPSYSFARMHSTVLRELSRQGFEVSGKAVQDKIVQKAMVGISGLPRQFGFSVPQSQKLSVKIEVDVRPPQKGRWESFFVARFGEMFPILKYDLPTLFSGKALAALSRPYERGRDYYDLIWFLGRKIQGNMGYFKAGLRQAKKATPSPRHWRDVLDALSRKTSEVDPSALTKDLRPFLEDTRDSAWIQDYPRVFAQLLGQQPK